MFPGAAKAASGDTTIYPIVCGTPIAKIYLAYGINSLTITNPNGCTGTDGLYLSGGLGATWTYEEIIGANTTIANYDPTGINLPMGTIGVGDSFTLTQTSTSDNLVAIGNMTRNLEIYFNKQINILSPNPVAIGQQVTVTGSNLSSVSSITFYGTNNFSATTSNRSATQLTFTVPLTVTDFRSGVISNVTPGIYRLSTNPSKTLTLTAAPVVISVSAEEVARLASIAAAAEREAEKKSARAVISSDFKSYTNTKLNFFKQAEINGITAQNLEAVQAEITALPEHSSGDIAGILKIARKYEVVGMIASDRVTSVYSDALVEIGLIPADSKHKAALTAAIKKLPAADRSSFAAIKVAIDAEMAEIQARINRSKSVLSRIASHRTY
jgi:hypothetical protein